MLYLEILQNSISKPLRLYDCACLHLLNVTLTLWPFTGCHCSCEGYELWLLFEQQPELQLSTVLHVFGQTGAMCYPESKLTFGLPSLRLLT